jgi:hypothetical protein
MKYSTLLCAVLAIGWPWPASADGLLYPFKSHSRHMGSGVAFDYQIPTLPPFRVTNTAAAKNSSVSMAR